MIQDNGDLVGFRDLSEPERKGFYQTAASLCGKDLQKAMVETIESSETDYCNKGFHMKAVAKSVADVESEFADQPAVLANILKNAERFTCPVSKQELVAVPKYEFQYSRENTMLTQKKRKLESEKVIKPLKKARAVTEGGGDVMSGGGGGSSRGIEKALTAPQKKKVGVDVEKLEKFKTMMASVQVQAGSEEIKDFVPAMIREKLEKEMEGVGQCLSKHKVIMEAERATPGDVKACFDEYKRIHTEVRPFYSKVVGLVEELVR